MMYFILGFLIGTGIAISIIALLNTQNSEFLEAGDMERKKALSEVPPTVQFIEPISLEDKFQNAETVDDMLENN